MPDFPGLEPRPGTLVFTNMQEWTRRTGVLPDYVSATFVMDASLRGVFVPVYIPRAMTVQRFYVANGASVAGSHQVALVPATPFLGRSIPNLTPDVAISLPAAQTGTSVWQALAAVTPKRVAPGLYWLAYAASGSTGTVQRLYNPASFGNDTNDLSGIFHGAAYPILTVGFGVLTNALMRLVPCLAVSGVP